MPLAMDEETALLMAVRDRVREVLALPESAVEIELDDLVPAIGGDKHVTVVPAGWTAGPTSKNSVAIDNYLAVRVVLFHKITNQPRDRVRNVFLNQTRGINADLMKLRNGIEFSSEVRIKANTYLEATIGEGFIEPLRFANIDPRPMPIDATPYEAASMPAKGARSNLAIKRGINFVYARFLRAVRT